MTAPDGAEGVGIPTLGECMSRAVQSAYGTATVQQCLDVLQSERRRHIPVVDSEGKLVGLASDVALYEAAREGDPGRPVGAVALPTPERLTEGAPVTRILDPELLRKRDAWVVVDPDARPVGIITDHDLLGVAQQRMAGIQVHELMTAGSPHSVRAEISCSKAASIMQVLEVHHLLVTDEHDVCGVVSIRDVVGRDAEPVGRVVGTTQKSTTTNAPLGAAIQLMLDRRISCLPVWNAAGIQVGILTRTDVVNGLARHLLS